jgi:hypothetical protein
MRGCLRPGDSNSRPGAERASDRDDLTQMIGVVVVQEQNRPEVRLVALAGRNEAVQIPRISRERVALLTATLEGGDALVPCRRVRRR